MEFPQTCYLKILGGVSAGGYLLSSSADFTPTALHLASTDDGSPRQRWKLVPVAGGPGDVFNITFVPDDQGLTYLTWAEDGVMFSDSDSGTGEQRWQFIPTNDASYLIKAAPVSAEDAPDLFLSCSADGSRVDMFSRDDLSGRQRWFVTADSGRVPPSRPRMTGAEIPAETKAGFFITLPTSDFQARLREGGTLTLSGKDLDLASSDSSDDGVAFMALDALELNQARIITGGKRVVIFVNRLTSRSGSIVSHSQRKAARGSDGVGTGQSGHAGAAGAGGGSVSLYVIEQLDGILAVDLRGQDGGDGGNGSIGATGNKGANGPDAVIQDQGFETAPTLVELPGDGATGGTGQAGGNGGNGGNGGDGGTFEFVPVSQSISQPGFLATGGQRGIGGQPAAAGAGGPGGDGGKMKPFSAVSGFLMNKPLTGGHSGAQGPLGVAGTAGVNGTSGRDGQSTTANKDLAGVVRLASRYLERSS